MKKKATEIVMIITVILVSTIIFARTTTATPVGPRLVSNTTLDYPSWQDTPLTRNDTKGRITTIAFNVTQQDYDWKAYAGNITGKLSLDDSNNKTIFDWNLATIAGEIYATRKSTTVTWADIVCANAGNVTAEQNALNIGASEADSIANTFDNGNHDAFSVGTVSFSANSCTYSDYTYVNGVPQTTNFDEILLTDQTGYLVYASLLSDAVTGFDGETYDFQILLPDDGDASGNTAYYFYAELT